MEITLEEDELLEAVADYVSKKMGHSFVAKVTENSDELPDPLIFELKQIGPETPAKAIEQDFKHPLDPSVSYK